jgi:hypothetical protein
MRPLGPAASERQKKFFRETKVSVLCFDLDVAQVWSTYFNELSTIQYTKIQFEQ